MHLARTDLELDRAPFGPDHRRVQRLVEVELGHRDVVLEATLDRPPERVDRTQGAIAILDRIDDDAHADEVVDLVELLAAHDHLLVDRPVVLRPAPDIGPDLELIETGSHLLEHLIEIRLALARGLQHHRLDLDVALRVQHREREIFELPLHVLDTESVRERRVDVECLLRDPLLLPVGERSDRAHVVQPVGELDQQDSHVLGHSDEHLAHRRGLLRLLGVELEAVELGDAVDDRADIVAELGDEIGERERGVLDRVVQQRAGERDVVEAEVGEDHRDAERMRDVRVARPPHLVAVRIARHDVGPLDERHVGIGAPGEHPVDQRPGGPVDDGPGGSVRLATHT